MTIIKTFDEMLLTGSIECKRKSDTTTMFDSQKKKKKSTNYKRGWPIYSGWPVLVYFHLTIPLINISHLHTVAHVKGHSIAEVD